MKSISYQLPSVEELKEDDDWMAGASAVLALAGGHDVRASVVDGKTLKSSRTAEDKASEEDYNKVEKLVAAFT